MAERLDSPLATRKRFIPRLSIDQERFGRASEAFARAMGTGGFLIGMTVFCAVWLTWNSLMPLSWQFDPRLTNFTLIPFRDFGRPASDVQWCPACQRAIAEIESKPPKKGMSAAELNDWRAGQDEAEMRDEIAKNQRLYAEHMKENGHG